MIEAGKTGKALQRRRRDSSDPAVAKRRMTEMGISEKQLPEDEVLKVEEWYLRGFTRPQELAKLTQLPIERIRNRLIPFVLRRLARGMSGDEAKAQAQASIEAQRGLLRFAWNEMLRAGKPSVKVQWAQIINTCHDRIDRLTGVLGREDDQTNYARAINAFIREAVGVAESTNDPAVLQRMESALRAFLAAKSEPVDAEFTEVPPEMPDPP